MGSGQILRSAQDLVHPQNITQPSRVEIRLPGGIMGNFDTFSSNSNALLLIHNVAAYRCLLSVAFNVFLDVDLDMFPSFKMVVLTCL